MLHWMGMQRIQLKPILRERRTDIYFGLDQLPRICKNRRGAIIIDEKIDGRIITDLLGYPCIAIPNQKTRLAKEELEDELFKHKLARDDLLIAIGGGTLTDLVAFTASTYMRGISLILIPTTLLSMVDAAIGGKTGIDTPYGKNLIGTFYLPDAIFIDVEFLKTVPAKELRNGLSEILKYGLILDPLIWEQAKNWEANLLRLIQASVQSKCKVVEADFEEKTGLRRILNFGHTVGHALEFLSHYQMSHGEAVALGCMAESYLSHILGYLSKDNLDEILKTYNHLCYPFKQMDFSKLVDAMNRDKKGKMGEARFVLIDQIGRAIHFDGEYCRTVPKEKIEEMISWIKTCIK